MEPTPPATGKLLKVPLASVPPSQTPPATVLPSQAPPAKVPLSQEPSTGVPLAPGSSTAAALACFRPPVQAPSASSHPDPQSCKRYGHKAPTYQAWYEMYLRDDVSDEIAGVLLDLSPNEVQELKSCIREMLRLPVRPLILVAHDIYNPHNTTSQKHLPFTQELIFKQGGTLLRWHVLASRAGILLRSCVVFEVSLEFPHLFQEPASIQQFEGEWWPDSYGYYRVVPYTYRREILVGLVELCAEQMKKYKNLRIATTDPTPYRKRPGSSLENDDASTKRARMDMAPISSLSQEHRDPNISKGKQVAR